MSFLIAYLAVLVVFGAIDAGWLTVMGPLLYRPTLGEILLPGLRVAPALLFYFAYPVGVVVFAVLPGLRSGTPTTAVLLALLFGALAYGTYDLTNYATLRHWTWQLAVVDIAYGAATSALAAAAAFLMVRVLAR